MGAQILAVANQKGGVGKTTTAINLATGLAMTGQRVLLVDMDPQGNLTSGVGLKGQADLAARSIRRSPTDASGARWLRARPPITQILRLVPADRNLTGAEVELVLLQNREQRLRAFLDTLRDQFDYVFIDTPPSLGLLTLNALVAADAVVIPLNCEYFALEGLADLVATLRRVRAQLQPGTRHRRRRADDVRRADESGTAGGARHPRVLSGARLRHGDPAQHPARRGAEPRHAGAHLRRASPAAPRRTSPWRVSSSRVTPHARANTEATTWLKNVPALGRGLSALIPDAPVAPARAHPRTPNARSTSTSICSARTSSSRAREWTTRSIEELAKSISVNGIIQPIVVRNADDGYEIVAGERRWRASQRAGLLKVPVVVRDIPEERLLAAALIENIQREDLNPIEEAQAYRRLVDEFQLTQEQIAEAVGKDRSSVANYVRLVEVTARGARQRRGRSAVDGPRARAARAAGRSRAAPHRPRRRRQASCRCARPRRS